MCLYAIVGVNIACATRLPLLNADMPVYSHTVESQTKILLPLINMNVAVGRLMMDHVLVAGAHHMASRLHAEWLASGINRR